jgi:hypothetical protein
MQLINIRGYPIWNCYHKPHVELHKEGQELGNQRELPKEELSNNGILIYPA